MRAMSALELFMLAHKAHVHYALECVTADTGGKPLSLTRTLSVRPAVAQTSEAREIK